MICSQQAAAELPGTTSLRGLQSLLTRAQRDIWRHRAMQSQDIEAVGLSAEKAEPADQSTIRRVITASAVGTLFEWYDFFVYGALASVINVHFAAGLPDTQAFVFILLTFALGFLTRPLGALVFGKIGDSTGRKGAFLITITLMGLATFAIGLLPTAAQIGIWAPVLLITCRVLQGFALGGEYGGAAIYVAEHAAPNRRARSCSRGSLAKARCSSGVRCRTSVRRCRSLSTYR